MKLRIKGNSIRLRLGRSEVEALVAGGVVEDSTSFDPSGRQRLGYRLVATAEVAEVAASFEDGWIVVSVPAGQANDWAASDRLGIEASQPSSAGARLRILIEKDLECLDAPVEESQADAFPRPESALACSTTVLGGPETTG